MAGFRVRHPGASEVEVRWRFANFHLGPEVVERIYGPQPAD